MFVLFSDTLRVGGVVEAVGLRTVVLRDYGGNVHAIPYSAIDTVTNLTRTFPTRCSTSASATGKRWTR
jgi:moderate conductance mechanosensitive channel